MLRCAFQRLLCPPPIYRRIHWLYLSTSTPNRGSLLGDKNILLMGPPGAGKTTVGRILAHKLGLPAVDIDDDVLEPTWNMPVAAKLASVGGQRFLEEEGKALCNFSASGCVISLSGSNPLDTLAMQHIKRSGIVVYLDVDAEDIIQRLARMKVNRVVGQEAGIPMKNILRYRKQFYEKWFDIRVLCGRGETVLEVADKVLNVLERYNNPDKYISTRSNDASKSVYFSDVAVVGMAKDGGLYVPQNGFPKLEANEWVRLVDKPYHERAFVLLEKCIHPHDISGPDLKAMVMKAYGSNFASEDVAPVRHLMGNQYIQELFHGPTASFKDLALQLMPQLFAQCLPPMCNFLVLVATSGDTGSAVLSGFSGLKDVHKHKTGVLVFFPGDGVSEIQRRQMTGLWEGNVRAVSVGADFDFCQRSIKQMFGTPELTGHLAVEYGTLLNTANSINWARLLPQVVYHTSSYLDLCRGGVISFGDPVDVCIPTGNFGNAMSAIYAKSMGLPIRKVICASNHNCVITDFITTGSYNLHNRPLLPSISPAIDILKSSNLERFIYHTSHGDSHLVKELFTSLDRQQHFSVSEKLLENIQEDVSAGSCSENECLEAIRAVYENTGYIMDTHTAVAKVVGDRLQDDSCPLIISATAHYGKFAPAVFKALGISGIPEDPAEQLKQLNGLAGEPGMHTELLKCLDEGSEQGQRGCEADYEKMVEEVEDMIQESFLKVV
ncbi:threonine synthase-like 1 [Periophthalmus magnuspinnatus]|uniref:threonine synthase-like 1 n=1 Tax=Periophthalmus magnuspinnatus TaxID=409849 RepID=UPI00145B21E9|nr:threonine synthase-like 1 [Periophthalmus magnuspinnatus]